MLASDIPAEQTANENARAVANPKLVLLVLERFGGQPHVARTPAFGDGALPPFAPRRSLSVRDVIHFRLGVARSARQRLEYGPPRRPM